MGPSPSADLVGSILGVEAEDNDPKQQRSTLRKIGGRASTTPVARSASYSQAQEDGSGKVPPLQIVWRNVLIFIYLHAAALYGFYLCFTAAKTATIAWCKSTIKYMYYANLRFMLIFFFCSILFVFVRWIRNYGWGTSVVGSSVLQSQVATSPLCCSCTNNSCSGECVFIIALSLKAYFVTSPRILRMIFTNGVATIAFITNSARLTLILTTLVVVSSSLTLDGYYVRSIPKYCDAVKLLMSVTCCKTLSSFISESKLSDLFSVLEPVL